MPGRADLLRECKSAVVTDHPDGTWSAKIHGKDDLNRWEQMCRPADRLRVDHGMERTASIPSAQLRDPQTGRVYGVPAATAEKAAERRGLKPVIHYGGLRVVTGPDGLLWREDMHGGMEPTRRCSITRPYFPCHNPKCEACG